MTFRDPVSLKFPYICLTGEDKHPKKTLPRKLVSNGDRPRAHCVTGTHATACSTTVDLFIHNELKLKYPNDLGLYKVFSEGTM